MESESNYELYLTLAKFQQMSLLGKDFPAGNRGGSKKCLGG